METKEMIKKLFFENVKGKVPDVTRSNVKHDGKYGHWLEKCFKIPKNSKNDADLDGYELKNETKSKTSFGDWSANRYIFNDGIYKKLFLGKNKAERQDSFCRIFGKPNPKKNNRYSWSGSPCPKYNVYNDYGQILLVEENLDVVIKYSYSMDNREDKNEIIPKELQIENLEIARWFGVKSLSSNRNDKCLKEKLEDKFNKKGWFTCKKDEEGKYYALCFGDKVNYEDWISLLKKGIVFFDSGMHEGNKRPYSQWRANNKYWDSLIIETIT